MTKLISLLLLTLPVVANSHAMLAQTDAESGSFYKGILTITHGCEGSATTKVTVDIPYGVRGTKPMPKAGWELDVVTTELVKPYIANDGKTVTHDVTQITWYGNSLEDGHFDEFVFRGQIGVGTGTRLYFPVRQECVVGEINWTQTPEGQANHNGHHGDHAGHAAPKLEYPAPVVRVVDGTSPHHH